ncbi:MAG: Gfo/Idh/MocA family oxidoreductase [Verrucomicrobia bacterium]|nr:Gfo/Idh/MocA family oxidoreductase [Verrucomicrobiota bacterium]MBU1736040.1 Gfo/Idh/MocA family oxidoreductase [Verrucomicrobiota bacterium]MBU1855824.1 Gfo/Idh/MocA family oxidoreductase [Verrucomicrobiota bacterium]
MIRIGAVNIDISHPKSFAEYLKTGNRARYVAVYNDGFRGDDEVEAFIGKYNLEKRCRTLEELADCVDVAFVHSCNWDKHLAYAKPFIAKKKPVFIDKPIVGNIRDCKTIEKLAAAGAVILGSSSVRYAQEIVNFAGQPESERGKILNVFGTAGVDEFNYAVHVVEGIEGLVGTGAQSCAFMGRSSIDGKICETFFVKYANGVTATYNTFQGAWQPFEFVIMTTKATYQFRVDTAKIYAALLDRICDYMETKKNAIAPVPALTESVKIMLAGRISREQQGRECRLVDIPANDPGYDGNEFERGYAAAAKKIYI